MKKRGHEGKGLGSVSPSSGYQGPSKAPETSKTIRDELFRRGDAIMHRFLQRVPFSMVEYVRVCSIGFSLSTSESDCVHTCAYIYIY